MIAEPYICIKGPRAGKIEWFDDSDGFKCSSEEPWQSYADFEREKLRELAYENIDVDKTGFYMAHGGERSHWSYGMINYGAEIRNDSESSRLLKRAEFLKAVCEKEGVEWLPEENTAVISEDDLIGVPSDPCEDLKKVPRGFKPKSIDVVKVLCDSGRYDEAVEESVQQWKVGESRCPDCREWAMHGHCPPEANCSCFCNRSANDRDYYTKAEVDEKFQELKKTICKAYEEAEKARAKLIGNDY